jgi:hypothetical protein
MRFLVNEVPLLMVGTLAGKTEKAWNACLHSEPAWVVGVNQLVQSS